jgi:calcium-translocating P-type ATPase
MARKNALIRHLPSVETLGSATVICTDKTGTLTQNRMEVKKLFLSRGFYEPDAASGLAGLLATHRRFFEAAFLCNLLKEVEHQGRQTLVGDPTEVALVRMARAILGAPEVYPRVDEVPFDSDRKRLSVLHRSPQGLILYSKGALETLLPLCSHVQLQGAVQPIGEDLRKEYLLAQDTLAANGLRVLAVAYRAMPPGYDRDHLDEDLTLAGLVGLEDPPRPEVPAAVAKCCEAGIKVILVTGDHPQTAQAVARQIGLLKGANPAVITGEQLRRMSQTQLQLALDRPELLFARVGADQKMRIVQALKAKGHVVAVTGDGVNDAPALRQADIGIAMGQTGTDVAREAADMVLLDDNFASIVAAVEEGRTVFGNIRKFLTYILTHNVPELVPYLAFVLFKVPPALTVIQILAVDLGTDMLPAVALGAEKPEPAAMHRPRRSQKEQLIDWRLLVRAYLFLGPLEAVAAMGAFFFVLVGGGAYGQPLATNDPLYLRATSACLSAIIIMQVVNVSRCRSEQASAFAFGLFSNRLILAGILLELLLLSLIVYSSLGNRLFATAPIGGKVWLLAIPMALAMLLLEELRRLLASRRRPR